MQYEFHSWQKDALAKVIRERRDIRSFRSDSIPEDILWKILEAGHLAPSVGFSQPWNFLILDDKVKHRKVYEHFIDENNKAAQLFPDAKGETYRALKLQGLLDAPIHIIVTCDSHRNGLNVLGRTSVKEVDEYSVCLAVQNIWLTARAEGIGIGWMSIYDPVELPKILGIPNEIKIIAYLCLGEPVWFPEMPMLETSGWKQREDLSKLVFWNSWNHTKNSEETIVNLSLASKDKSQVSYTGINSKQHKFPIQEDSSFPSNRDVDQRQIFNPLAFQSRLDALTKPPGSLGKLESYAWRISKIQNRTQPILENKTVLILAADHGIAEEKVSAYPQDNTYKMVYQYLAGGGAVNSFARTLGAKIFVADLGVNHEFQEGCDLLGQKVRMGTRNFLQEPALKMEEVEKAIQIGKDLWKVLPPSDILSLGEVGIGNTTVSTVIAALLLDYNYDTLEKHELIGKGTGVDAIGYSIKKKVVSEALALYKEDIGYYRTHPLKALTKIGGLEIAGMVGCILAAKPRKVPIVLDGLISSLAGWIAVLIDSSIQEIIFVGHTSAEKFHKVILDELKLESILNLNLRLGEATGSTLALGILEQACRFSNEMKTWDEVNWS